ncbi:hypothetical protein GCM10010363_37930 [Streptomyces omiyaensis]|nr:hypothetical protein GCM10010363_37930 [Streptomyces omiyaensis]
MAGMEPQSGRERSAHSRRRSRYAHEDTRGLPEIPLLLPPETAGGAVVLGEERIPLRTVR